MKNNSLLASLFFVGFIFFSFHDLVLKDAPRQEIPVQEQTGTVSGKIELQTTMPPVLSERRTRYRPSGDHAMMYRTNNPANEFANVVIYLDGKGLERTKPEVLPRMRMDQKEAEFLPHILPVQRGTVIDFINQDNTYHNVFSLSPAKKFNIGRRPTGEAVPIQFDKSGVVQVFCDIHSNMTAYIIVLDNPFFVHPDKHGTYSIEHIPPGTYTIKVWHERLTSQEQTVMITADGTAVINFLLE